MANDKNKELSNEQRKALTEHVLNALASGEPRMWSKSWDAAALSPRNPITGTRYRGINRAWLSFVAMTRNYGDNRWYTFNEIRKQEGWRLRKGSKGSKVEKWGTRTVALTDEDGNPRLDEDGNERTITYLYLQGMNTVFNGSCVEGLEPLTFEANQEDAELFGIADALIGCIELHGKYVEDMNDGAFFSPANNLVHMPIRGTFDTARDFIATLAHEFAHSTQDARRMGRVNGDIDGEDSSYAFEELVAEMSALFIQADLGFDSFGSVTENSLAYLQGWARKRVADGETVALVAKAINTAQKVADWIIDLYEQVQEQAAA